MFTFPTNVDLTRFIRDKCGPDPIYPLEKAEDFGTAASGFRVNDYCHFCFQNGAFTEPDISMRGMIDKCVAIMGKQGIMPEAQARTLMTEVIPKLKRWQAK